MSQIKRRRFLELSGLAAVAAQGTNVNAAQNSREENPGSKAARPRPVRRQESPRNPTGLLLVAPSIVTVSEEFSVGVKVLTEPFEAKRNCFTRHYPTVSSSTNVSPRGLAYMDNVPPKWQGTLRISGDPGYAGPPEVSFGEGGGPYPHDPRPIKRVGQCRFDTPGVHFITFTDPASGITRQTNPICVREEKAEEKLFWGDIHGHTIFTDGLRSPEEVYFFARDEAFLDVCALTDHTEFYLTDRQWEYFTGVTNDFNQPGRFVTLIAQEWTNFQLGHRNIYHRGASAPFIRATDPVWGKLPKLFEFARKHSALVVPHHPAAAAMGVDWSLEHDPDVERLVEIYSCWGNSERSSAAGNPRPIRKALGGEKAGSFVVDALRRGRRYGIIASGDIHDGRMGDDLHSYQVEPPAYKFSHPGGLVGIWAKELSREAVFDALWNRSVYGTTGARIVVQFSIEGHKMGSVFKGGGSLRAEVRAWSEIPFSRVDLVRNGEECLSEVLDSRGIAWQPQFTPTGPSDCYYVRLSRSDGQMVWSSPIWVEA
ncbi:MAG: CehA/McbA family metallohydrolase [Acidobacteriota bacterium]